MMRIKLLVYLSLFAALLGQSSLSEAQFACEKVSLTKGAITVGKGKNLFIVEHPTVSEYDTGASSFLGLLRTYNALNSPNVRDSIQSVYMVENDHPDESFFPSCHPDNFVASSGGELKLANDAPSVIFTGGYFSACMRHTVIDVLKSWTNTQFKYRRMIFPLNAIYDFPETYDGVDKELTSFRSEYLLYNKISGNTRMTEAQVSRLMGEEQFMKRTRIYFNDWVSVTSQSIADTKLIFPPGSTVVLHIVYRVYDHTDGYQMDRTEILQQGSPDKKVDIFFADDTYLRGILQSNLKIW